MLMVDLRTERERRGLSIQEVARVSQIPESILLEIEEGRVSRMEPEDLAHYRQRYERHLGIRPSQPAPDPNTVQRNAQPSPRLTEEPISIPEDTRTLTIPIEDDFPKVRLVIIGFLLTMATVLVLQVGSMLVDRQKEAVVDAPTDQEIVVRAVNPVEVSLYAESDPQPSQLLDAGESVTLRSTDTIVVEVDSLHEVTIHYNGEIFHPLGELEFRRRLVFIRDAEE